METIELVLTHFIVQRAIRMRSADPKNDNMDMANRPDLTPYIKMAIIEILDWHQVVAETLEDHRNSNV